MTEEDAIGTVCQGCWRIIPENENVYTDDSGEPYCEECYGRLIGWEEEDE